MAWGRSPVRIDIAGGWSDTPPYSIFRGGSVVNFALDLNGQQPVQVLHRVRALQQHFAHVRYVEQPAGRAHRHMLFDHAGFVLHRHFKAAEFHHLSAAAQMRRVKRRAFQFQEHLSFLHSSVLLRAVLKRPLQKKGIENQAFILDF